MTFVPWSGLLAGVVAMGNPVAVAMGFLLMGLLTAERATGVETGDVRLWGLR